jgi:hypothetical protein
MLPIPRRSSIAVSAQTQGNHREVQWEPLITRDCASPQTVPLLATSPRCLAHCWLDDEQRDQGQRCLVACWQSDYQSTDRDGSSNVTKLTDLPGLTSPTDPDRAESDRALDEALACLKCRLAAETPRLESHPCQCHSC